MRPWAGGNDNTQRFRYVPGASKNVRSYEDQNFCADSQGGMNSFLNPIIIWPCHDGINQQWDSREPNYKYTIATSQINSDPEARF